MKKHIETILPESAACEVSRLLVGDSDATCSAALTDLLRRATDCEIPQADTLPVSDVEELVPLCLSILRRHWTTPLTALGDGTDKRSLEDTFRQLIFDRVQGDEALGIPSATTSIADAVTALRERKIGGVPKASDGMSMVRLTCDNSLVGETLKSGNNPEYIYGNITEIIDNNEWDVCVKRIPFRDIQSVQMNCKVIRTADDECLYQGYFHKGYRFLQEISFPYLEWLDNKKYGSISGHCILCTEIPIKKLYLPKFKGFSVFQGSYLGIVANCPLIEEINLPSYVGGDLRAGGEIGRGFRNNPSLRVVKFTGLVVGNFKNSFHNSPNLIHFEISEGLSTNFDTSSQYGDGVKGWSPTMALRTDTDTEDYVDLREDKTMANNLEQFLWNFQHYIADRVADRTGTSALTMTLTSAVYEALQTQEGQTILATLTNKNWTVAQA